MSLDTTGHTSWRWVLVALCLAVHADFASATRQPPRQHSNRRSAASIRRDTDNVLSDSCTDPADLAQQLFDWTFDGSAQGDDHRSIKITSDFVRNATHSCDEWLTRQQALDDRPESLSMCPWVWT